MSSAVAHYIIVSVCTMTNILYYLSPATPHTLTELVSHISPSHIVLVHQVYECYMHNIIFGCSMKLFVCVAAVTIHKWS